MIIKLFNRDGANFYIEKSEHEVKPNIYVWNLKVDEKHKYCLEFMRLIGDKDIEAVDPSGGPMINLGDEFYKKFETIEGITIIFTYKIVKIIDATTFWISERNNYN